MQEKKFLEDLNNCLEKKILNKKYFDILKKFYTSYKESLTKEDKEKKIDLDLFSQFLKILKSSRYKFKKYHQKIRSPFDYYQFGISFLKPLVKSSKLLGEENLKKIEENLKKNENSILLSNHQSESDPQAISILLKNFPHIAEKIIYVAGERVTKDPLAIPFSMGCDLLCIYSKKYINTPSDHKRKKQLHNNKTMTLMSSLLKEGSKIIYVAPSGGRDRKNSLGEIEIAPFDQKSLEMFYLMSKKAKTKTHFYPLSLDTYDILPPPDTTQIEMGEQRIAKRTHISAYLQDEINMSMYEDLDRVQRRIKRASYIENLVKNGYNILKDLK